MRNLEPGSIFSFQIRAGEFAFARIMLNIQFQCLDSSRVAPDSPLREMQNDILIDVYRDTSAGELPSGRTVLVSGILTSGRFVERGTWKICGRQQVDPSEVSFPERLAIDTISRSKFTQGEVVLPVKISMEETERIDVIPRSLPAITLGEVVLYQLGRKQEIKNPRLSDVELRSLARYDLRFSQHRSRVFECLDLDPDQSYYERARALGYDLARFYGS